MAGPGNSRPASERYSQKRLEKLGSSYKGVDRCRSGSYSSSQVLNTPS